MINDAIYTHKIKFRMATATVAFNKTKTFCHQTGLKFKEETNKMLHLGPSFVWCWNLHISESRSEICRKFWNVVLDKISWTACVKNVLLHGVKEERNITHRKRGKPNWVGYSFCRNYLLKRVTEDRSERKPRKRYKRLLDDLKEMRRYWKLKEETLDITFWRVCFGRCLREDCVKMAVLFLTCPCTKTKARTHVHCVVFWREKLWPWYRG